MLARLERGNGLSGVQLVRCGDVEGIHARICQQRLIRAVPRRFKLRLEPDEGLIAQVVGRAQLHRRMGTKGRQGQHETSSETHDSEAYVFQR